MSKPLKKYKKELTSLFNNVPKEKRSVYDHICNTIDEYPNVDTMSYDDLVEQFGEPENIYYQYIDDNDLYSPVQKHKRSYKKVFITVLVLILVAFVVEFISIAYEARKSFIDREIVEITSMINQHLMQNQYMKKIFLWTQYQLNSDLHITAIVQYI